MAFPTFNLSANLWHAYPPVTPPAGAPDATIDCGLMAPRPTYQVAPSGTSLNTKDAWVLLCPPGTDIRDSHNEVIGPPATRASIVECPAGSARYYLVAQVDDVARGYPNEFRVALLTKFGIWPTPIP